MEIWRLTFFQAVLCFVALLQRKVAAQGQWTLSPKGTALSVTNTDWMRHIFDFDTSFLGIIVLVAESDGGIISLDNVTITTTGSTMLKTCDFEMNFCGFMNEYCLDEGNWNRSSGIISTSGGGDTWLTTIDFHGESIMNVTVDYMISTGSGTITIYDMLPVTASYTAVAQLYTPNAWTKTEDYTCNFDSGKGKCLWVIQETDENVFLECKLGDAGNPIIFDQSSGGQTEGKYLYFGQTGDAQINETITLISPAVEGQTDGVCFSLFFYIDGTGIDDAISIGYRLSNGSTSTVESFGDSSDQSRDQWRYASVNIEQGDDFRIAITFKYAGRGTIAVDNLLIYTRLSTANGQPGHLGCGTDEQKSLIEIGGLDCVFNSTDNRNHTPTNEVLMEDGMCLWKNVISLPNADRFAVATEAGNSYLAVDGPAQLRSTDFPVVPIEGDDKRLRCFSMDYKIVTGGTLSIMVDGHRVWSVNASVTDWKSVELGVVLVRNSALGYIEITTDSAAQGVQVDNTRLARTPCGCTFEEFPLLCDWEESTPSAFRQVTEGSNNVICSTSVSGVVTLSKSFPAARDGRCIRFDYKRASAMGSVIFSLELTVEGATTVLWNTTETGTGEWITYLLSYSEEQEHDLLFRYNLNGGSHQEICLDNVIFVETNCSNIGCNAGEFEGETVDHGVSQITTCMPCGYGTYATDPNSDSCTDCNNKTSNSTRSTGSASPSDCVAQLCGLGYENITGTCTECAQNTYKDRTVNDDNSAATCEACPDNSVTTGTGVVSVSDCRCAPGYELDGENTCTACNISYYNPDIDGDCVKCENGTTTQRTGANMTSDCVCSPGEKFENDRCVKCEVGSYQTDYSLSSNCMQCTDGTTTMNNGTQSADGCVCDVGKRLNASSVCVDCDPGNFKDFVGNGMCTSCNVTKIHTTSETSGDVDASSCLCQEGYEYDDMDGMCKPCMKGFYKSSIANANCTMCPVERPTTLTEGVVSLSECVCRPGYEWVDGNCTACMPGFYKESPGNTNCTRCPDPRQVTLRNGEVSQNDCLCPPGYYSNDGAQTCSECGFGRFSNETSNDPCFECGPNQSTATANSTDSSDCMCISGTFQDSPGSCAQCEEGSYTDVLNTADTCTACSMNKADTTTEMGGANSSALCVCVPGMFDSGGTCTNCSIGSRKTVPGDEQNLCLDCPTDSTTDGTGKSSDTDCVCVLGLEQSGSGATLTCSPCSKGTFREDHDTPSCTMCPMANQTTVSTGSNSSDLCVCKAGFRLNGTCVSCPRGEYQPDEVNVASCTSCPDPKTTEFPGSTMESDCSCPAGQYKDDSANCIPCPKDTYKETVGNSINQCLPCGDGGKTSMTAADSSTACYCPPGYKTSATNICEVCGLNKFSTMNDSATCEDCLTRTITLQNNSASRDDCMCQKGNVLSDECLETPRGYYTPDYDSTTCTSCPTGETTLETGSTSPSDCVAQTRYKRGTTFSVSCKLPNIDFMDGYNQLTSSDGCALNSRLTTIMGRICNDSFPQYFIGVTLTEFRSGSVVVFAEVDVEPNSMITQQDIINAINNNADEFTSIGGSNFTLDTNSTRVLSVIDHSVTPGKDDSNSETIAIILGTVVPGLILIALLLICWWRYSIMKGRDKTEQYRHEGMTGAASQVYPKAYSSAYSSAYPNAYTNAYPSAYPRAYPDVYPVTMTTQTPWISRMARWTSTRNPQYSNASNTSRVYVGNQGYSSQASAAASRYAYTKFSK